MNPIVEALGKKHIENNNLPELNPGDTVKVFVRIIEGNKERTQAFEGIIIKKRGSGVGKTITVRKTFQGVGVERVFPVYSPRLEKIQVVRRGDVRRAERSGKATRLKEKIETRYFLVFKIKQKRDPISGLFFVVIRLLFINSI